MAQPDEKAAAEQRRRFRPVADGAPKFDLESYISNYDVADLDREKGQTRLERLLTIGSSSRHLCLDALKSAIAEAKHGKNVHKYLEAVQLLAEVSPNDPLSVPDHEWVEMKQKQTTSEMNRLEHELKGYKNNLIKESIRMGNEDLGSFYFELGDYPSAFKAYSRMRENCTTQKHIGEMNLRLMLVVAAQDNWRSMPTYVSKVNSSNLNQEDKDKIEPILNPTLGLAALNTGSYREAASHFLVSDPAFMTLEPTAGIQFNRHLLTPNDVATYGALCALATMNRAQLQAQVLDNTTFRNFLELEPHLRRAITCFCASKYTQALAILDAYRVDYLLDIHLQRHVPELFSRIRRKSIVQYFRPFGAVELPAMAAAFGTSPAEMTSELARMIAAGELDARIDSVAGMLVASDAADGTSAKVATAAPAHARAADVAARHEDALRLRLFRINCQLSGLELRTQKGHAAGMPASGFDGAGVSGSSSSSTLPPMGGRGGRKPRVEAF